MTPNAPVTPPQPSFFTHDGIELAWHSWGSPGRVPVLLQHGFSADTITNWMLPGIVQDLVDAGRWVVGLDARGHGKSATVHDPAQSTIRQMATDVSALIDVLQTGYGVSEIDFGGYSMGGFIGMHVVTTEPRVRRAVIAGVGATAGGVRENSPTGESIDMMAIADTMERYANDPTMDVKSISNRNARDFLRYARYTGADLRSMAAHMRAPRSAPQNLQAITANVLVLAGAEDHLARTAEELAALIPNSHMTRIPGDHLTAIADLEFRDAFTSFLCDGPEASL